MSVSDFAEQLKGALALEFPYPERPLLPTGREAAVLALFSRSGDGHALLFTRRTDTVETHKGQISFPGGARDPDDRDEVQTALRETHEEVGIPPERIRILGSLPPLWTVTGFWVTPVVGMIDDEASAIELALNPHETADIFWAPLEALRAPGAYSREFKQVGSVRYPIHVYQFGEHRIWGATGAMLKNLIDRLDALSS